MAQSIFQGLARSGGVRSTVGVAARSTSGQASEAGIGAVVPWADKLWFLNYPDDNGGGVGLGLWSMGKDQVPTLVAETNNTDTARLVHNGRLYIGRHVVDYQGNVTPITGWAAGQRICAYTRFVAGDTTLFAFTMSGSIYSINLTTNVATLVNNVVAGAPALNISGTVHGKTAWGHPAGRYIFCVFNGSDGGGRLAVFDTTQGGASAAWTSIDTGNNSWINIVGCSEFNKHIFATGHDFLSGLLWVFSGTSYSATPKKYRIPLASNQQLHTFQQEWMRLKPVETERYLLDLHGGFYQLSPLLSGTDTAATDPPYLEAVARHLRTIPDFCSWNGMLVLAGNQATPQSSNMYPDAGQPQSGLLLTTLDDVWSWGRPAGTGFWYRNASVTSGVESDLMLLRGYAGKELHLTNGTGTDVDVDVRCRVNQMTANYTYTTVTVPAGGHAAVVLASADWCAVRPVASCTDLTAWVVCS